MIIDVDDEGAEKGVVVVLDDIETEVKIAEMNATDVSKAHFNFRCCY